jgi:putative nucleotidyltransferase with HDIG domain
MELRDLIRRAQSVVSLPEVYYRVQELIDDPGHDTGTLARVIESDSGLTARLLRAVNSPLYGLARRVDRVSYALTLVGSHTLRDILLATTIVRAFGKIPVQLVDLSAFWHHSIYCGLAARQLAGRCRVLHRERMLVAGLVHDIGQLVLYQLQPDLSARALALAEPADDGACLAEREVFGYTHAEVGAELLKSWSLPTSLQETVRSHHQPEAGSLGHALDISIVHIANSIANRMEPGRNLIGCEPRVSSFAWQTTGLEESVVGAVLTEANERFLETLDVLLPGRIPA